MSRIAAAALTADRINYWVRRHTIQYGHGTHPSQSRLNQARDRRVGLLAIGQCLQDQYDVLATTRPAANYGPVLGFQPPPEVAYFGNCFNAKAHSGSGSFRPLSPVR